MFHCCLLWPNFNYGYLSRESFVSFFLVNSLMLGGNKRPYILKQTDSLYLQFCLSMYDLLLPPSIQALNILDEYILTLTRTLSQNNVS